MRAARTAFLLSVLVGLALTATWTLTADVGYFMYVVERMAAGERLYVDLPEVNPPLAIWLLQCASIPLRLVGVEDPYWPPVVLSIGQLAASLLLSHAILSRTPGVAESQRWWVLALFVVGALWVPAADFANREHQAFVLLVPYLLLTAALLVGASVEIPGPIRLLTGAVAGVAIAFKPHFVLAGLVFEAVVWAARGRPRAWLRLEAATAGAVVLVYGAGVLLLAPEYLRLVRSVGGDYVAVFNKPLVSLLVDPQTIVVGAACVLAVVVPRDGEPGRRQWVFAVAGLLLLAVALAQRKGWNYHFAAAVSCAVMVLGHDALWPPRSRVRRGLSAAIVGLALVVALWRWATWLTAQSLQREHAARVQQLVAEYAPDRRILVISSDIAMQYPTVTELGLRPTTGYPSFWHFAVLFASECAPESVRLRDQLLGAIREALPSGQLPGLLLLDRMDHAVPGCGTLLDVLRSDPAIRAALARYEHVGVVGPLDAYALKRGGFTGS